MFPLYDTIPSRKQPVITRWIIILNALLFLYELTLSTQELEMFFRHWGLVPRAISDPQWAIMQGLSPYAYWTFFTNMFLHGGWMHFISNMWTLHIFGDNVEDKMSRFRFLVFYLLAGIFASTTHYAMHPMAEVPAVGASGAISGVMGAYMVLFPHSRIIFLVPFFFMFTFVELNASFYIFVWFIGQFFSGVISTAANSSGAGIAFWAHIGGFLAGIFLFKYFIKKPQTSNEDFYL